MIRRPPRSTQSRSSAASDVYKRQDEDAALLYDSVVDDGEFLAPEGTYIFCAGAPGDLSLIHISEPTRLLSISYAVFCLKKKTIEKQTQIDRSRQQQNSSYKTATNNTDIGKQHSE